MDVFLKLSLLCSFPVVVSVILYLLDKKTAFGNISGVKKQVIYGLIFGGLAVIGTEFGAEVGGVVVNSRDASVLIGGLVFGAPAGIIAGLIGGIERFFAVYWGVGSYTRVACTVSTILAGFIGAVLRKYMFDDKKPSVLYALAIGFVTEVIHMLMVFVTNMSDPVNAFVVVKNCSFSMILVNSLAVMLSVFLVTVIGEEKVIFSNKVKQISTEFQRWLLLCVVVAFLITSGFTYALQLQLSDVNSNDLLRINITDVVQNISDVSDDNMLKLARVVKNELVTGFADIREIEEEDLEVIQEKHGVIIYLVGLDGKVFMCTTGLIGYDMADGKGQADEFLILNKPVSEGGKTEFVQSFRKSSTGDDMKFAGIKIDGVGFMQIGYDAESFQSDIAYVVNGNTKNRHVGQGGSVIIADKDLNIVSYREVSVDADGEAEDYYGKNVSLIGLPSNIGKDDAPILERFTATVYGESYYCMYDVSEGYYIISMLPVNEAVQTRDLSIYITIFMEIIVFVGLFILVYFLIKTLIVNNIRKVNDSLAKITGGNLDVVVDVRTNEEFSALSDDINSTVTTLKRYIDEAAARIDKELEIAKVIQSSTLPSAFRDRTDIDVFAMMNTAKEVGGDFYDFYFLEDGRLLFLIADVSGKGITAAMFMMKAKTLIKGFAEKYGDVAQIMTEANDALCEGNDAEMFVTCWIGILDFKNNTIEFSNAGHNSPLIRRKGETFEYFKSRQGFVLGGMSGLRYSKRVVDFVPGDEIFLYTDGVTEATDSNNKLYGDNRLNQTLNSSEANTAESLCVSVKDDVEMFVDGAPQFDDITMLSLKYIRGSEK